MRQMKNLSHFFEKRLDKWKVLCYTVIAIEKTHADLAHLVERNLAKVEVAGSSPVIRSRKKQHPQWMLFFNNFNARAYN